MEKKSHLSAAATTSSLPSTSQSRRPFKILIGLALAEEENCKKIEFVGLLIVLIILGFWFLPGASFLWKLILITQGTVRYRTGLMSSNDDAKAMGSTIYGVSQESLKKVSRNLEKAWKRTVSVVPSFLGNGASVSTEHQIIEKDTEEKV